MNFIHPLLLKLLINSADSCISHNFKLLISVCFSKKSKDDSHKSDFAWTAILDSIVLGTSSFKQRRNKSPENPDEFLSNFYYVVGNDTLSDVVAYTANLTWANSVNVESYDVYINGDYYGTDVQKIQITTNDVLRIQVVKQDDSLEANINFDNILV